MGSTWLSLKKTHAAKKIILASFGVMDCPECGRNALGKFRQAKLTLYSTSAHPG